MIDLKRKTDILEIIERNQGITYEELVHLSKWSPSTIEQELRRLKKQKAIETMALKDRKAKGFRLISNEM